MQLLMRYFSRVIHAHYSLTSPPVCFYQLFVYSYAVISRFLSDLESLPSLGLGPSLGISLGLALGPGSSLIPSLGPGSGLSLGPGPSLGLSLGLGLGHLCGRGGSIHKLL